RAQVSTAAERGTDVHREAPHIGTLAAADAYPEALAVEVEQLEHMNGHAARGPFELDAGARVFVQRLAVALERRVHRRNLLDLAAKTAQHRLQRGPLHRHRSGGED